MSGTSPRSNVPRPGQRSAPHVPERVMFQWDSRIAVHLGAKARNQGSCLRYWICVLLNNLLPVVPKDFKRIRVLPEFAPDGMDICQFRGSRWDSKDPVTVLRNGSAVERLHYLQDRLKLGSLGMLLRLPRVNPDVFDGDIPRLQVG
ncbi:hypothetical protein MPH_00897 [Macrophomina phaseolina MS6]|uniref:Uncharacterized protein n=1 Tax=Macrophomina phaseolina (strain MS6) TaxID=1126212 RepID=K2SH29_MACPH|nr:hypothetical protein MPH_00897 [Macrophomina phaseolina MS6]